MFGSLMRFGEDDDDLLGAHMRNMNNMMNNMFNDPFGMMGGFGGGGFGGGFMPPMMQMPNMNTMMNSMQQNGNCHSYSSSTVMSMSNGPDGRPQVYQATSSTRSAPGGIRETKKAVCDSRTGIKKLAIGHAIGDKAHIIEKEQNYRSGEQEERQDFINIDEEESEAFNREWQEKARQAQAQGYHSIDYPQHHHQSNYRRQRNEMLALPESSSHNSSSSNKHHLPIKASSTTSTTNTPPSATVTTSSAGISKLSPSRKRDHDSIEDLAAAAPSTDKMKNKKRQHQQHYQQQQRSNVPKSNTLLSYDNQQKQDKKQKTGH